MWNDMMNRCDILVLDKNAAEYYNKDLIKN